MVASITRDRGCLYYVPWIASFSVCLAVASLGVWAYYTRECKNRTLSALNDLNIDAKNVGRIDAALIATAITYLVVALVIFVMSLWRSFIEAAHDATGVAARGALAFMVFGFTLNTTWWLMVMWLVLLVMGDTVWAAVLYITEQAIEQARTDITTFGAATWLPSSNKPCPGQCLDFTVFAFISSDLKDACICDPDQLSQSQGAFQDAFNSSIGVLVGSWVMLVAATWLSINYACQFAHTKRERELLLRVGSRTYIAA